MKMLETETLLNIYLLRVRKRALRMKLWLHMVGSYRFRTQTYHICTSGDETDTFCFRDNFKITADCGEYCDITNNSK